MTRAIATALALALVATLAGPRPTGAEPRTDDPQTATAKEHFFRGEKMFALGRFGDALAAYEAAFEAKPLPAFLFNIGQCHRNLGNYESAIFSFRKYLKLAPDAPNAGAVRDLIAELEGAIAAADRRQRDVALVPTERPPQDRPRPFYRSGWFWGGVGAAALAGTATAYLLLSSDEPQLPASQLGNIDFGR